MTRLKRPLGVLLSLFIMVSAAYMLAGCTKVILVTPYDEQFDKQVSEFEKTFNAFVFSVLLAKDPKVAAFSSNESQKFYYETLPEQMTKLVNRALIGSMDNISLPNLPWGKESKCNSMLKLDKCDGKAEVPAPNSMFRTAQELTASWDSYKRYVFSPVCSNDLQTCCPVVAQGRLDVSLSSSNTTTFCLLNYLWDSIAMMARMQWSAENADARLTQAEIKLVRKDIQAWFRMLAFFEQQKMRTGEAAKDK